MCSVITEVWELKTKKPGYFRSRLARLRGADFEMAFSNDIYRAGVINTFGSAFALACGAVSFTVHDASATVWASSVDVEPTPIRRARRILVSHLTDVQASGNVYDDASRQVLLKWGTTPPIVRVGSADISIALDEPARYAVYALDTTGARIAPVPCRVEGGKLAFTASVRGPEGARMLYEVVRVQ